MPCPIAEKSQGLMVRHKPSSFSECRVLRSDGGHTHVHTTKITTGMLMPTSQTLSCPQENASGEECGNSSRGGLKYRYPGCCHILRSEGTANITKQQTARRQRVRVFCFVPFCFGFCPTAAKFHSQAGGQRNFSFQINMEPPAAWLRESEWAKERWVG